AIRYEMVAGLARAHQRPISYCNLIGGNDQLVFDGNSFAVNSAGNVIAQLAAFREDERVVDTDSSSAIEFHEGKAPEQLFAALSLGVRDYFRKCGFHSAVVGLSGRVDYAVTAVIAVDALGAENVTGVSMSSQYSSRGSIDDARVLARNLGIKLLEIPIGDAFAVFKSQFKEIFKGLPENETEENMQPRLRAMTLMALSNKFGHLVLSTGNKSELAVGYCTIYGDMAGGLAVISDVPKTMVYELARWINSDYSARSGRKGDPPSPSDAKCQLRKSTLINNDVAEGQTRADHRELSWHWSRDRLKTSRARGERGRALLSKRDRCLRDICTSARTRRRWFRRPGGR